MHRAASSELLVGQTRPEKVNFAWPLNRYRDYVGEAGDYNATTTIMPVHCCASSGSRGPLSLHRSVHRFSTGMKLLRPSCRKLYGYIDGRRPLVFLVESREQRNKINSPLERRSRGDIYVHRDESMVKKFRVNGNDTSWPASKLEPRGRVFSFNRRLARRISAKLT